MFCVSPSESLGPTSSRGKGSSCRSEAGSARARFDGRRSQNHSVQGRQKQRRVKCVGGGEGGWRNHLAVEVQEKGAKRLKMNRRACKEINGNFKAKKKRQSRPGRRVSSIGLTFKVWSNEPDKLHLGLILLQALNAKEYGIPHLIFFTAQDPTVTTADGLVLLISILLILKIDIDIEFQY